MTSARQQSRRRWSRRRRSGPLRMTSRSASATITSTPLSPSSRRPPRGTAAVGLDPRSPHRRSLAAVEHPAVDRGAVGGARHQPVEHVELADQMALADPADRRVARHLPDVFGAEGQQADARAAPGRGRRSFAAGMAGADDEHVVHARPLSRSLFHVKQLLAEAKRAEQRIEQILDPGAAGQPVECARARRRSSATST